MFRVRNFLPLVAVLTAAAILGAPSQANAAFSMTITVSGGMGPPQTVTINDNDIPLGTATDMSPFTGRIIFDGMLGDFDIQSNTGTSNAPGTPTLARLTINNLSINSTGLAVGEMRTITVTLTDTGFMSPLGNTQVESQLSTTQLPTGTNVTFQSALNGVDLSLLSLGTVGGTRVFDGVSVTTSPFTLSNTTVFNVVGQGVGVELAVQSTGLTALAVPVPAGVVLALTGLPVVGLGWMRRRNKVKA